MFYTSIRIFGLLEAAVICRFRVSEETKQLYLALDRSTSKPVYSTVLTLLAKVFLIILFYCFSKMFAFSLAFVEPKLFYDYNYKPVLLQCNID